jgi:hypothetical protein
MGMTGDLEAAVAAGSTMVRVGSGIFGRRTYGTPTLSRYAASPLRASR